MNSSVRPGGLTSLAIINFVYAGLCLFTVLLGQVYSIVSSEEADTLSKTLFVHKIIIAILLIISGIGYLQRNNFYGRYLGSVFCFIDLACSFYSIYSEQINDISLLTIIGIIYPMLSLLLINLIFKDTWIRKKTTASTQQEVPFESNQNTTLTYSKPTLHRHIFLMAKYELKQIFRSSIGVILFLCTMILGLGLANYMIELLHLVEKLIMPQAGGGGDFIHERCSDALQWVFNSQGSTLSEGLVITGEPQVVTLGPPEPVLPTNTGSSFLLLMWIILGLTLPYAIISGAFNQISRDIKNRRLRYLLLRTSRASIFLGRFAGISLYTFFILTFLVFTIAVYVPLKMPHYSALQVALSSSWALAGLFITCLPYIALSVAISAMVSSGTASLSISTGLLSLIPLLAKLSSLSWEPLQYLSYLLPLPLQVHIFNPSLPFVILGVTSSLTYTLAYLSIGYLYFSKRDL